MLPTTSSRKPLLRSNSDKSERSGMRNWPLFGFLFALVFFFYIVYIYQAQSAELDSLKEQFDNQVLLARNTKNELIDSKADAEKLKGEKAQLLVERDDLKAKNADFKTNLAACTLKNEQNLAEKSKNDETLKEKDAQIEILQKDASEVSSLRSLLAAQEKISEQLNQTILALKDELAVLKSTKMNAPSVNAKDQVATENKLSPVEVSTTTLVSISNEKTGKSAAKEEVTTSKPMEAPKVQDNMESPLKDKELPKIQTLGKEEEENEDILDDQQPKKEGVAQVDVPKKNVLVKEEEVDKDADQAEEALKPKTGDYDDKAEV